MFCFFCSREVIYWFNNNIGLIIVWRSYGGELFAGMERTRGGVCAASG